MQFGTNDLAHFVFVKLFSVRRSIEQFRGVRERCKGGTHRWDGTPPHEFDKAKSKLGREKTREIRLEH